MLAELAYGNGCTAALRAFTVTSNYAITGQIHSLFLSSFQRVRFLPSRQQAVLRKRINWPQKRISIYYENAWKTA